MSSQGDLICTNCLLASVHVLSIFIPVLPVTPVTLVTLSQTVARLSAKHWLLHNSNKERWGCLLTLYKACHPSEAVQHLSKSAPGVQHLLTACYSAQSATASPLLDTCKNGITCKIEEQTCRDRQPIGVVSGEFKMELKPWYRFSSRTMILHILVKTLGLTTFKYIWRIKCLFRIHSNLNFGKTACLTVYAYARVGEGERGLNDLSRGSRASVSVLRLGKAALAFPSWWILFPLMYSGSSDDNHVHRNHLSLSCMFQWCLTWQLWGNHEFPGWQSVCYQHSVCPFQGVTGVIFVLYWLFFLYVVQKNKFILV